MMKNLLKVHNVSFGLFETNGNGNQPALDCESVIRLRTLIERYSDGGRPFG